MEIVQMQIKAGKMPILRNKLTLYQRKDILNRNHHFISLPSGFIVSDQDFIPLAKALISSGTVLVWYNLTLGADDGSLPTE